MAETPEGTNPDPARDGVERLIGGRFRVTRLLKKELGVETLLGTDLEQGETVVIKSAAAAVLSMAARIRLEREGEVLCRLRTPDIASLLHMGCQDHHVYLVMPFIPGVTLQARLRQAPLSVRETLALARRLLAALATVHAGGVLHRDVKPANVIVAAVTGHALAEAAAEDIVDARFAAGHA